MAPTNKELRTLLRPPPMKLLPRHCPDWCKPDKGRDLSTVERTEFWQFGDQGPGDCLSHAGHGSEKILFLDPDGRSAYLTVDQDVHLREFFLQRFT
jgi:hypothetical protein